MRCSKPRQLLAVLAVVGVLGTMGVACTTPGSSASTSQLEKVALGGGLPGIGFAAVFALVVTVFETFLNGGHGPLPG
jgi:hypothetical protein